MSLKSRRELLASTASRYQKATKKEKQIILDEFTATTGYHRKYATRLLKNHREKTQKGQQKNRKPRPRSYGEEVQAALVVVWEAANRICSKRLVPFIPEMVSVLERHEHLSLSDDVRARLLKISFSTVDRLLYKIRWSGKAVGKSTTRPGALIKSQIAIRSFSDWDDARPGFVEADLVAHCGTFVGGQFLQTLVMTDIASGWTEFAALLYRSQEMVKQSIESLREQFPFDLLGLDTDNGTEFLNYLLLGYCLDEEITFTRSRPYKKNDQCFVEQKNGAIIRRFVGYDRFEGMEPNRVLSALYDPLRLYINYFQPSMKLISKTREGSRVIKKYDRAQTPYQRIMAAESVPERSKQERTAKYQELDPVQLLDQIANLQDLLWQLAYVERETAFNLDSRNGLSPRMTRRPPTAAYNSTKETANSSPPRLKPAERMYRRTKKPRRNRQGKRWWRTRIDPFAEVRQELEGELQKAPYADAKALFKEFQRRHPGRFADGQLRTFQRRVQEWRTDWAAKQVDDELITNDPESIPTNSDSG